MSQISDYAAKMKAHQDKQDKAVDGLVEDVKSLNDTIAKLQSTQGSVTAEDQALLDDIEAKASAVADKLDALDAQTSPPAPPSE